MKVYRKNPVSDKFLITKPEIEEIIRGLESGEGGATQSAINVLTAVRDRKIRLMTKRDGAHCEITHTLQPEQ